VLLTDAEMSEAKLADFGLAKSFEQAGLSGLTATGAVGGTLYFMPREQITHFRVLRPAGDVWAMGATLYHMLTLSYPRDFVPGADPLQVILQGGTVPIRRREPGLPADLAEVIDRAVDDDLARLPERAGVPRAGGRL
jgi:serine/threonine protein kinase